MKQDVSALLPDGSLFEFWEKPQVWDRELIVDAGAPNASDDNDGSPAAPFRTNSMERGGTSRDAKIFNNIFYDCGEAAIVFPTRDNAADGNLYVRMRGGYLRVMYPEPEVCLNLPAWQEFCGFDLQGRFGWFDIDLDEATGAFTLRPAAGRLPGMPSQLRRLNPILDPEQIRRVPADPGIPGVGSEPVLPGPGHPVPGRG